MRYGQSDHNPGKRVLDLQLPADFWNTFPIELNSRELDSLEGCPEEVQGKFNCRNNQLESLIGSPKIVNGYFDCQDNKLVSLMGNLYQVNGDFNCWNNQLESLIGAPKIVNGSFDCTDNELTSLMGVPPIIGGYFNCWHNNLTSLAKIHTHIRQMNGSLCIGGNPITSHLLGILLISGCKLVSYSFAVRDTSKELQQAIDILNKYVNKGRAGIMDCQAEMIAAGLDDFAQI